MGAPEDQRRQGLLLTRLPRRRARVSYGVEKAAQNPASCRRLELLGTISESLARGAPAVATRDHSIRGRVDILTWRRSGKHRLDRLHALFGTLLSPPTTAVLSIL